MSESRREIWPALCLSYGIVSGLLWAEAIAGNRPVGTCSRCGQFMRPQPPEQVGQRIVYPARCACGREVEGMGPRVEKPKGAK